MLIDRRQFTAAAAASAAALLMPARLAGAARPSARYKFCAFIKFVQSLNYDELAEAISAVVSPYSRKQSQSS